MDGLKEIMLSERSQMKRPHIILLILNVQKRQIYRDGKWLPRAGVGMREELQTGVRGSWGDGNVLTLDHADGPTTVSLLQIIQLYT